MLQPDGVVLAARRWLDLLNRSSSAQAAALFRADPKYADLSESHYSLALEWLAGLGLVTMTAAGQELNQRARTDESHLRDLCLFEQAIEEARPTWLPDADALVLNVNELPEDAWRLAQVLDVSETEALNCVRAIHGRIDLAHRAEIGAAGEIALISLLEAEFPGSTNHIAAFHDGFGYDIEFCYESDAWHLEVKSTQRRGRVSVHLSRHEHDVSRQDPNWRMVVIRLTKSWRIERLWTVPTRFLLDAAPIDTSQVAHWESTNYEVDFDLLVPGLQLGHRAILDPLPEP